MSGPGRISAAAGKVCAAVIFLLPLVTTLRLAVMPTEALVGNLLIDDAFYYVVPARNFVSGLGYSFDGETRTNGVQPLWAIVCLLLTAILPRGDAVLHGMFFLSGVLWIGAGWLLYRVLCSWDHWWATLAALGWTLVGIANRLALQGMENGLHAFLFALCLAFAARRLRSTTEANLRPEFFLSLGLLLTLFTLARIDSVLLALVLGVLVLLGLIQPRGGRAKWNLVGAVRLALPGLCLCGGLMLLSLWYFGDPLPISGRAKMFYQSDCNLATGDFAGELRRQASVILELSLKPLTENLNWTLHQWLDISWPSRLSELVLLGMSAVGGLFGLGLFWRRRKELLCRPSSFAWFVIAWVAFVILHFLVYSLKFSKFTKYGTWYFSPEIMLLWICYGGGIALCGRAMGAACSKFSTALRSGSFLPALMVAILLLAAQIPLWHLPPPEGNRNPFFNAARWLADNLPAGTKIGCFSAGIVGYFAAEHQVVNLDGLMNNRHYLEEYLKKDRIPDYVRQRGLEYLADYCSKAAWRGGYFWGLDLREMQLVHWQPMAGDLSYAIWRILPPGSSRDILEPCSAAPCHRLSQIQYAAQVLERFEVVSEEQLAEKLGNKPNLGKRVMVSFVESESPRLHHVLVSDNEATAIRLTPADVKASISQYAAFGSGLKLFGLDTPCRRLRRCERFFITLYWTLEGEQSFDAETCVELWLRSARPGRPPLEWLWHHSLPCHGTYPLDRWQRGEVVVETYGLWIPRELPPGPYALELRVPDGQGHYLPASDRLPPAGTTGLWLTNLEIR